MTSSTDGGGGGRRGGEGAPRMRDAVSDQLKDHAAAMAGSGVVAAPILTTSNGAPIDTITASMTVGSREGLEGMNINKQEDDDEKQKQQQHRNDNATTKQKQPKQQNQHFIMLQDFTLLDHLSHFDRERIPERVVHAKGAGAFGYFIVTTNVGRSICKADMFQNIGERTDIAIRFSTVGGELGSSDHVRDPRGFAIKFYTETQGNWDLVGNNTPIFFIRDPILFPSFIHTQKRNPVTHCKDPNMVWDFISHRPETLHQISFLFSDRGIPFTYRYMNGYGSHTYKNVNSNGDVVYVKYHMKTDQGIKNMSTKDAAIVSGIDPDYSIRDLYNSIANQNYPSWTIYVQIMTLQQASDANTHLGFDPFDITKVWSHKDYPLYEIGRIYLNRNPTNYYTDVEQIAFSPSHMIPGIEPSPDKMLQARLFSYPDTQRYRLGVNYQSIPVNKPKNSSSMSTTTYHRDGYMQVTTNGGGLPNYAPNSFNGPTTSINNDNNNNNNNNNGDNSSSSNRRNNNNNNNKSSSSLSWHTDEITNGRIERVDTGRNNNNNNTTHNNPDDDDNYFQVRDFYNNVLNNDERQRLITNIAESLSCAQEFIRKRVLIHLYRIDKQYGTFVQNKMNTIIYHKQQQQQQQQKQQSAENTAAPLNPPRTVSKGEPPQSTNASGISCPYGYSSKL